MYVVCVKMAGVWEEDEKSPELKIAEKEWCKTEDEMMKVTMYVSYRASAVSKVARGLGAGPAIPQAAVFV